MSCKIDEKFNCVTVEERPPRTQNKYFDFLISKTSNFLSVEIGLQRSSSIGLVLKTSLINSCAYNL